MCILYAHRGVFVPNKIILPIKKKKKKIVSHTYQCLQIWNNHIFYEYQQTLGVIICVGMPCRDRNI